jgi:hypothetical protein
MALKTFFLSSCCLNCTFVLISAQSLESGGHPAGSASYHILVYLFLMKCVSCGLENLISSVRPIANGDILSSDWYRY